MTRAPCLRRACGLASRRGRSRSRRRKQRAVLGAGARGGSDWLAGGDSGCTVYRGRWMGGGLLLVRVWMAVWIAQNTEDCWDPCRPPATTVE